MNRDVHKRKSGKVRSVSVEWINFHQGSSHNRLPKSHNGGGSHKRKITFQNFLEFRISDFRYLEITTLNSVTLSNPSSIDTTFLGWPR